MKLKNMFREMLPELKLLREQKLFDYSVCIRKIQNPVKTLFFSRVYMLFAIFYGKNTSFLFK